MVTDFEIALGMVAPFYNLIMAAIVLFLFLKLFKLPNRLVYLKPWKVLFAAFIVYLFEEAFTVMRKLGVADVPIILNGLFEMIIISLFIYMLFLQKEYIKRIYRTRVRSLREKEKDLEKNVKKIVNRRGSNKRKRK
ncbi:MAG: hypothetical protein V1740_07045 [Candidatus Woesearchaeota archaeon]